MENFNLKTKTGEKFYIQLENLDPVTFTRIVQKIDSGYGDYTQEKYNRPEPSREEIKQKLKNYSNRVT